MSQDKIKFGQDEMINNDASNVADDIAAEVEIQEAEMAAELDMQEVLLDQIAQLKTALTASENKLKEQEGEVKRAYADVENMRRRTEQEIDKARKFALERFAGELLPVIDNMERAIELADQNNDALKPMLEGIELTLKTMKSTVEKFGLKELNPHGETFNPDYHQAMSLQESAEHEPNTVMFVMQKGYELNGRVVRPAMVMVSKAPATNN